MDTAPYPVRQLARTLKEARVTRGLTQRELAERAGFGQNRLALIEAGKVDLRASTLVQLARALDLELVLTPRRVLPAVQSLTGRQAGSRPETARRSVHGTPMRILRRMQQHIATLEWGHISGEELPKVKRAVQALIEVGPGLGFDTLQPLRRSMQWLAFARANVDQAQQPLAKAAAQLQELYQALPAVGTLEQAQRAAYSLEDESS